MISIYSEDIDNTLSSSWDESDGQTARDQGLAMAMVECLSILLLLVVIWINLL
jgi:hypothetical protein